MSLPNSRGTTGVSSAEGLPGARPGSSSKRRSPWRRPSTIIALVVACLIPAVIGARTDYVLRIPLIVASLHHVSLLPFGFASVFLAIAYVFLYACDAILLLYGLQRDWQSDLAASRAVAWIVAIFLAVGVGGFLFNFYQVSQLANSLRYGVHP